MKLSVSFIVIILLSSLALQAQNTEQEVRIKKNFNEGWKFKLDDHRDYCDKAFNDEEWRALTLPHDWSVEAEFNKDHSGRNAFLPGGIAWYRKTFEVKEDLSSKHVELQFDGIYKNASIWLNNHHVGTQRDGFTSFYYDISELLIVGENTLAVRVDNFIQPNCRWYTGSGIYRNVWLTITENTHVANWGTYITTPEVSKEKALVKVATSIENFDEAKEIEVEATVYDASDNIVAMEKSVVKALRYRSVEVLQEFEIETPMLWDLTTANQYKLITKLKCNGEYTDVYESKFGIRTLKFDAEKGFFLNGKGVKMKGVCLHHDAGPLGGAVPIEVWENRLSLLKDMGCNAIRTAHNPVSPEFLDLCDEMGFLVMNEFVDKWTNQYRSSTDQAFAYYKEPFADPNYDVEWQRNFETTIKRDRNHPSVIFWSVGNENFSPGTGEQKNGLRRYASFVRDLDPTRPVISGMERGKDMPVQDKVNAIIETCKYMDVIALNYGEQWCKLISEQKPGMPYVSTESYTYFNSELEKRFANIERSPWLDVMDNESNMGLFLWVGLDYLGESRTFPKTGTNAGLIDMGGFRKNSSYLYEAFWSEKPMVHMEVYDGDADDFSTSGRWGWPPMSTNWNHNAGTQLDLVTYTNCESVNLYLNGKLLGNKKLAEFNNWIMKWKQVAFKAGTLTAKGVVDGKEVCEHSLKTAGETKKIKEKVIHNNDIVRVELQLSDKKGTSVIHIEKELGFALEGPCEIIGIHNGDMACITPFKNHENRITHQGKCAVLIKINQPESECKLIVSAEGVKTKIVKL